MGRLIIDGNSVYEMDEECERARKTKRGTQTEQKKGRDVSNLEKKERREGNAC